MLYQKQIIDAIVHILEFKVVDTMSVAPEDLSNVISGVENIFNQFSHIVVIHFLFMLCRFD
jgi:hypothetical protein